MKRALVRLAIEGALAAALACGCANRALPLVDEPDPAARDLAASAVDQAVDQATPQATPQATVDSGLDLAVDAGVDLAAVEAATATSCSGDGGALLWAKQFSGIYNIASDLRGRGSGVAVTGVFGGGAIDFGEVSLTDSQPTPHYSPFVVTLDGNGKASLARDDAEAFGYVDAHGDHFIFDFVSDADGGGGFRLWAEDADGYILWSHDLGAITFDRVGMAVDGLGNLFISGLARTAIDLGSGPIPATPVPKWGFYLLAKLDSSGRLVWARTFDLGFPNTPDYSLYSLSLSLDANGEGAPLIAGELTAPGGIGGAPMPTLTAFVAKYDADGNFVWMRAPPSANECMAAISPTGEVAYACFDRGASQLSVGKLDAQGAALWERDFSGAVRSTGLLFDGHGDVLWSGDVFTTLTIDQATYVAGGTSGLRGVGVLKLDGVGQTVWSRYLVHPEGDGRVLYLYLPHLLVVDASDAIYLTGSYQGALELCVPILPATLVNSNTFVVKLSP